jgi:hypothetical protein
MSQFYGNVHFLGVARVAQGQGIVIASHAYNTETDLNGVKQALEQSTTSMSPGKHYSFTVANSNAWHLIADDMGLIYVLICAINYPQRCAHSCLEELQRTFVAKAGEKATSAKERQLDRQCGDLLQKICRKYDDLAAVDKLSSVSQKVESVKLVMQDNIDIALQNCVKLESIGKAAEELQQQAGVFKRNAQELKKRMWWKNLKMKLLLAAIILIIIGIIAAVIAVMVEKDKDK